MTEEDQKNLIEIAQKLQEALEVDERAKTGFGSTHNVAVWAAARLRRIAG